MTFEPMGQIVPDMDMWGATDGKYSFMISMDHSNGDEIRASVKVLEATPFDNTRLDLGTFNSVDEAITACREWRPS